MRSLGDGGEDLFGAAGAHAQLHGQFSRCDVAAGASAVRLGDVAAAGDEAGSGRLRTRAGVRRGDRGVGGGPGRRRSDRHRSWTRVATGRGAGRS